MTAPHCILFRQFVSVFTSSL